MNAGAWASWVSAVVAVASAIGSATAWWQSRKAKTEAARQAARSVEAAERAAGATERLAAVEEARAAQAAEEAEAEEQSPWILVPIPGEDNCWLQNKTGTAKYDVKIQGRKIRGPAQVPVIEGNRRVALDVLRIGNPDDRVTVTWHRQQDLSDQPHQWHDELPPARLTY